MPNGLPETERAAGDIMGQTAINVVIVVLVAGLAWLMWLGVIALIRRRVVRLKEKENYPVIHRDGLIRLYVSAGSVVTLALFLAVQWLVA